MSGQAVELDARYRAAAAALWPAIAAARRIVSPFHIHADPDAVGSALGVAHLLAGAGKEVAVHASDGDLPATLAFLPGAERIVRSAGGPLPPADLILALDSSDPSRLGDLYEANRGRFVAGPTLAIDHHVTNTRFGVVAGAPPDAANFVDPEAAATAEMVYLLARAWDLPLTPAAATCLLTGLYGDTLGLQTSSTTPRTLRVAADLLAAGADLTAIVNQLYRARPFAAVKLWGAVLSRAAWCGQVLWSQITPETLAAAGATDGESGGAINFLTGTTGARVTVLLHRDGERDEWRAGLRTLTDGVDVARIAAHFGGGGHRKAAGCRIPGGDAERDAFLRRVDALAAEQVGGGQAAGGGE